eukprot:4982056-Amphidinium_carterae.1
MRQLRLLSTQQCNSGCAGQLFGTETNYLRPITVATSLVNTTYVCIYIYIYEELEDDEEEDEDPPSDAMIPNLPGLLSPCWEDA